MDDGEMAGAERMIEKDLVVFDENVDLKRLSSTVAKRVSNAFERRFFVLEVLWLSTLSRRLCEAVLCMAFASVI